MTEFGPSGRRRTVYGMSVAGLATVDAVGAPTDSAERGLIPVGIRQSSGSAPPLHSLDAERSCRLLSCGRHLLLNRCDGLATFYGPALSPDLLAHPYLGPVAATFSRWAGREVFHAGAFVAADRAWLLIGPRTAGKSTLVAALAAAGVTILADDIVVINGGAVYRGPRTVDLRQPIPAPSLSGAPFRPATPAPVAARLGTRWRVALPPAAGSVPIGGWIFLGWGDRTEMVSIPMSSLLGRLAVSRSLPRLASDPSRLLSLAAQPAWDLRRRRDWADLPGTVDLLLAQTTAATTIGVR